MMTDEERVRLATTRRKNLEFHVNQAELLMGLVRKHISRADEILHPDGTCHVTRCDAVGYDERNEMIEAYKQGKSMNQIARDKDRSVTTVQKYLKEAGVFQKERV